MFVCIQAQHRDAFVQERYGQYDLSDPFLALQRDNESAERQDTLTQPHRHLQGRAVGPNPLAVLKLVMAHCKRMQERMMGQLAAAESRHRRVSNTAVNTHSMTCTAHPSSFQICVSGQCCNHPSAQPVSHWGSHSYNRLVVCVNVCVCLFVSVILS